MPGPEGGARFESLGFDIESGPERGPDSPELAPHHCLVAALNRMADQTYGSSDNFREMKHFVAEGDIKFRAKLVCDCGGQCYAHPSNITVGSSIGNEFLTPEVNTADEINCAAGVELSDDYVGPF